MSGPPYSQREERNKDGKIHVKMKNKQIKYFFHVDLVSVDKVFIIVEGVLKQPITETGINRFLTY